NFALQPTSPAIDAARSEIGPLPAGDAIFPTVNQLLTSAGGVRTDPTSLPPGETPGRSDIFGGVGPLFCVEDPRKIVTLPGSGHFGFQDQGVPVLTTDPDGISGPASTIGTYNYVPINGQRDSLGYIRIDDPNVPNVGSGASPFGDVGAIEFVDLHPPKVTGVTETPTQGATPVNFY